MTLVCVHETEDTVEALVIKSALEAYGMFVSTHGLDTAQQLQITIPPLTTIRIMVSDEDAAAARELISQASSSPSA